MSSLPMLRRCFERQYWGLEERDRAWLDATASSRPHFIPPTPDFEWVIWSTRNGKALMSLKAPVIAE